MKNLIIAEKPSVAKDIAKVLKCKDKKEGYIEGSSYIITWAIGHLAVLCDPEDYDVKYRRWWFKNLPILPEKIQLKPNKKTYKQYQVLKTLLHSKEVDEVICATDAGREGELIFRYIYELAGCQKPFKRLWISSLTEEAIEEGMKSLKDGREYDALYYSAKCRSESDWLIGINGSRAYTIQYNNLLSIGRVQTPTLKMIVDRDEEIENFTPKTYWEVKAVFQSYTGLWTNLEENESKIDCLEKAEEIKKKIEGKVGQVKDFQRKKVTKKHPLLYDLTELQRDGNQKYGYTAQKTLNIAQGLYEKHKLITYPRTDSRYLSKDLIPKFIGLINKLSLEGYREYTTYLESLPKLPITPRIVNDGKVSDHHGIIPTGKKANIAKLSIEEKNIYDLVVRRFLCVFYPDYQYYTIDIVTMVDGECFKSKEQQVIHLGWRKLYDEREKIKDFLLPIQVGDEYPVEEAFIEEKQTQPPKKYNEALLLSAMENAGKFIEDEELKEELKDSGIGTPATRAAIIERLIEVGYVVREGKNLRATEKGRKLIEVVTDSLASPELTGKWERALNKIAKNQLSPEKFMEGIHRFTTFIVQEAMKAEKNVVFERESKSKGKGQNRTKEPVGDCPVCKMGKIIEGSKNFYCTEYKNGCKFGLFKEDLLLKKYKKKMTRSLVAQLIKENKAVVKGMTSPKTGGKFDATIKLKQQNNGYWGWEFIL